MRFLIKAEGENSNWTDNWAIFSFRPLVHDCIPKFAVVIFPPNFRRHFGRQFGTPIFLWLPRYLPAPMSPDPWNIVECWRNGLRREKRGEEEAGIDLAGERGKERWKGRGVEGTGGREGISVDGSEQKLLKNWNFNRYFYCKWNGGFKFNNGWK